MPSDLSRVEVKEEGNLLIEAVSLLVQRQRESEGWIAEQIWLAEERAVAAERRYADLEVRLTSIEAHLASLAQDVEPVRSDAAVEERLARLREQVEGLKSGADGRSPKPDSVGPSPAVPEVPNSRAEAPPAPSPAPMPVPARQGSTSFWELLGPSPQDRVGFLLISTGAVAVLYAVLTQLRFS